MANFADELRNAPEAAEKKRREEEEKRQRERLEKFQKENRNIALSAVEFFQKACREEAAAGKRSVDYKPDDSIKNPYAYRACLELYDSAASMLLPNGWTRDRARDCIVPIIEEELSTMGLCSYKVSLWEFNSRRSLFTRYLGFRIQASW